MRHPGEWKGSNKALAAELGISYGKLVRLKQKLIEVEFIQITTGNQSISEPDHWHILNIWSLNQSEMTLAEILKDQSQLSKDNYKDPCPIIDTPTFNNGHPFSDADLRW